MNKDLLYFITKDIKDIYVKMSTNKINNIDNTDNIIKLKELLLIEKDFYDNLTYDEAKSLFEQFIDLSNENNNIIGRIINKLNDLVGDKYFYESLDTIPNLNDLLSEGVYQTLVDSGALKKIINCKKYVVRDIRLLSLYFIENMEKDGYISNEYSVETEFCKIYRTKQIYAYAYYYSDLEKELLDNNFEILNYNLMSIFAYQFQNLPYRFYLTAKVKALNEYLKIVIEEYNLLNNDTLTDDDKLINLLYVISTIKALAIIDNNVINILKNSIKVNSDNDVIYEIIMENINNITKEKKNIKYLTLNKNDKYL